jgi:hypothetical protein
MFVLVRDICLLFHILSEKCVGDVAGGLLVIRKYLDSLSMSPLVCHGPSIIFLFQKYYFVIFLSVKMKLLTVACLTLRKLKVFKCESLPRACRM